VDLGAKRPVFVPFDLVYNDGAATAIYRANSNGAACHTSPQQALINAIYEVVERDALMVAWLNQLSLPRIALGREHPDPWDLRATLDRLDLQLEHVAIGTDIEIPVMLGVLRDRRNPDLFLVDMVACLNPHRQLNKLYRELGQFLYPYLVRQTHFVNERTHDPDPDNVVSFADHVAFIRARRVIIWPFS
jgi:ribosomal protein S12 methylthiotransferase accessory factor YcaO